MALECGQAWGHTLPSSSASVPSLSPSPSSSPVDPVLDPVSTPSDPVPVPVTDPVPDDPSAPAPASVPSYPSITVDDHHRTKHVRRLELVTFEDGEVVMSYDHSVAVASAPQRPPLRRIVTVGCLAGIALPTGSPAIRLKNKKNCTGEAQKAETVLSAVRYILNTPVYFSRHC